MELHVWALCSLNGEVSLFEFEILIFVATCFCATDLKALFSKKSRATCA